MSATTPRKTKSKQRKPSKSRPTPAAASVLPMAPQNLRNMIGVGVVPGNVVLGLFAARQ